MPWTYSAFLFPFVFSPCPNPTPSGRPPFPDACHPPNPPPFGSAARYHHARGFAGVPAVPGTPGPRGPYEETEVEASTTRSNGEYIGPRTSQGVARDTALKSKIKAYQAANLGTGQSKEATEKALETNADEIHIMLARK